MAPETNAVPAVCRIAALDSKLAEESAAYLAVSSPKKNHEQLVDEMLACLRERRLARENLGLNHWEEYAPRFAQLLVDRKRKTPLAAISAFIGSDHEIVLEYAWRITRNWDLAERAVAETYVELLRGKTTLEHFYHALKMNSRDMLCLASIQRKRSESLESMLSKRPKEDEESEPVADLPSPRGDDQDPMEILIRQEEEAERERLLQEAYKDPRWRYIKRRDWARPLAECAELEGSFE